MGIEEQILEMKYQEGIRQAEAERNTLFVTNLLQQTDFSDERIAALVNVPVVLVKILKENQFTLSGHSCS